MFGRRRSEDDELACQLTKSVDRERTLDLERDQLSADLQLLLVRFADSDRSVDDLGELEADLAMWSMLDAAFEERRCTDSQT